MNLDDISSLPPTLTTPQAAELLGVHAELLYRVVREGEPFPVEPLRLGRKILWPTAKVVAMLTAGESSQPTATPEQPRLDPLLLAAAAALRRWADEIEALANSQP